SSGRLKAGRPPASNRSSSGSGTDEREEVLPQRGLVRVAPAPERRHRARVLLPDTAHLRAQMGGLEVDGDAVRVDQLDERVGDLLAEPLLDGEAPRVELDEPGQLGDADDLVARDVGDVRVAEERQRV